jgi:hypothetical protein
VVTSAMACSLFPPYDARTAGTLAPAPAPLTIGRVACQVIASSG